jgi:DNA-binding NarL/FixJ family response regulator
MNEKKEQHEKSESKTRILIVDDHPVVRQGVTSLVSMESDLVVCVDSQDWANPAYNRQAIYQSA